jgi:hypothetical protein
LFREANTAEAPQMISYNLATGQSTIEEKNEAEMKFLKLRDDDRAISDAAQK